MIYALERLSVQGVANNRGLLLSLLRHPLYARGDIHTHFIERSSNHDR
jgi:biotin carboxylase